MRKKQDEKARDRWLILLVIISILILLAWVWQYFIRKRVTPIAAMVPIAPIQITSSSGNSYSAPVTVSSAAFDIGFNEGFAIE